MLRYKANDFGKIKQRWIHLVTGSVTGERSEQGRVPLAVPRVSNHGKSGTVDFSFKASFNLQFLLRFFSASMKRYLTVFFHPFKLTVPGLASDLEVAQR